MAERIIQLDAAMRERLTKHVANLPDGAYRFELVKFRKRRGEQANKFWWACIIPAVSQGLKDAWGESLDPDSTHWFLKDLLMGREVCDRNTGETKGRCVPRSSTLDSKEFSELIEGAIKFAAESLGVFIPSPEIDWNEAGVSSAGV